MTKKRTISQINSKIEKGTARVLSVQEFIEKIEDGEKIEFDDIDVITTATKALMSGISGVFSFRVSPPKEIRKFKEVSLNGIKGFPGPCPNEFLGIIDLILYGTEQSETIKNYSGGKLFRDLVEGNPVKVIAKSVEGIVIEKELKLKDMQFARMMGTRQAIRNYFAMVNPSNEKVDTIFSALPFEPNWQEMTFSGCGAMNPFQNDPNLIAFGVGMPILVNGAKGYLIGPGTRNDRQKPNMMTIANFEGMIPEFMGAFRTSYGLEPICSIGVPIPILNQRIFEGIVKSDKQVPLTILNVIGRNKLGEISYGDVWDKNFLVKFDPSKCKDCDDCPVTGNCPTNAFDIQFGIDRSRCFNCGTCFIACPKDAFEADLKKVKFNNMEIPIVLRQSDRNGAIKLAKILKSQILSGEFPLRTPTDKLDFAEKVK